MPTFRISVSAITMLKYDVTASSEEEALKILRESKSPSSFFVDYSDCSPDFGASSDEIEIEQVGDVE